MCTLGEAREDSFGLGERKTGRAEKEERVREVRKREEGSKGERGTDDQVQERPLVSVCKCAFV